MTLTIEGHGEKVNVMLDGKKLRDYVRVTVHFVPGNPMGVADIHDAAGGPAHTALVESIEWKADPKPEPVAVPEALTEPKPETIRAPSRGGDEKNR